MLEGSLKLSSGWLQDQIAVTVCDLTAFKREIVWGRVVTAHVNTNTRTFLFIWQESSKLSTRVII